MSHDFSPNPGKWLTIGILGLAISLIGFFVDTQIAAWSFLLGLIFVTSIAIGMLFLVMIHHIFDAHWSVIVRRQAEHYLSALPYLGILFIPLFALTYLKDQGLIWLWMDHSASLHGHGTVASDILYQKKTWWLSEGFFWFRAVFCFTVWIYFARIFRRNSFSQDSDGASNHTYSSRNHAAAGLILVALTWTAAAFDWIMSLEYHWVSTMFGVWMFASAMRAATAVMILTCGYLVAKGPLKGIFNTKQLHDVSTLAFAFTVFWAYITFSQYFLIWNANIPEETFWFIDREQGIWWPVSMMLIFGYFLFPFLYMLQFPLKTSFRSMAFMAIWLLSMNLLDIFFNILPSLKDSHGEPFQMFSRPLNILWYIGGVLGAGGILLWAYWSSYRNTKIIPIRDPRIEECLHHNH